MWTNNSTGTGGTVSASGSYKIHRFSSSGSFVTSGTIVHADILIVAGGGNGGGRHGDGSAINPGSGGDISGNGGNAGPNTGGGGSVIVIVRYPN